MRRTCRGTGGIDEGRVRPPVLLCSSGVGRGGPHGRHIRPYIFTQTSRWAEGQVQKEAPKQRDPPPSGCHGPRPQRSTNGAGHPQGTPLRLVAHGCVPVPQPLLCPPPPLVPPCVTPSPVLSGKEEAEGCCPEGPSRCHIPTAPRRAGHHCTRTQGLCVCGGGGVAVAQHMHTAHSHVCPVGTSPEMPGSHSAGHQPSSSVWAGGGVCALLSCVWKPRCSEEIAPTAPSKRPCSCGVGTSTVRSVLRCTDCKAPR